jgi:acyl transferase domain-containing protein/acyl carrier protein
MKTAIIGVGLRLPPNCNSLDSLWSFLESSGDAISRVPEDRWDPRRFADPDPDRPGKTYVAKGGYLRSSPKLFDPGVFGISPREAQGLDPQQRLLLESTWEAFEDGGMPLEAQEGSRTGVFVGGFCLDHLMQANHPANRSLASSHSATSATMTILSNRLSYAFNLKGPSFTVDTACSSSLVALHCACQSLRSGETAMALAGGVNVMMRPEFPIMMSKGRFLSDHGNCRAFDASAAGYVRGEGAAMVLLKPLDAALADGDSIHAVIEATGVNQDGRTPGISLPNSEAQEALMREVYTQASVAPAVVDYVEAHGTGTQAGDPLEARALDAVFREGREPDQKLWIGSIKTNFGHTEAAAGIAGVLKAILVLKNRQIPPSLHFKEPNAKIPFDDYRIQVASESVALPTAAEKPILYAGVNSFGYGGTNGHAVLSSAPTAASPGVPGAEACDFTLVPVSSRSPEALRESASRLAFFVRRNKDLSLGDLYHSLTRRRSHLKYRMGLIAADMHDLRQKLMLASNGEEQDGVRIGSGPVAETRPVFVYTGMGPQWWAMGRELFEQEPICAETLEEVEAIFQPLSGWSLKEAMLADEATSPMMRTEVAQPANLVIQVALTRLWKSWGIEPAAVIGHSVGEVVSSYVAGVYTLEEAVQISYHRSRLQAKEANKGAMLAVGLPEAEAADLLEGRPGVSLAAVNSFSSVTLSGDSDALEAIAAELEQRDVFHKKLRVEVAYHSPQMAPLDGPIQAALSGLCPKAARIPLVSTVTGALSDGEAWTAEYWWQNVRQPVRFAAGAQALMEQGHSLFLEVGPHPVLGNSLQEVGVDTGKTCRTVFSLRRKEPEPETLRNTLAALYSLGVTPDWTVLGPQGGRFVRLPGYAWQRQEYWQETPDSEMDRIGLPGPVYQNQLIHAAQPTWEVEINSQFFPFLHDHGVQGQTVFPGMGYVESALALQKTVSGIEACCLRDIDFEKVLIVDSSELQQLISSLNPASGEFTISSRVDGRHEKPFRHARGRLSMRESVVAPAGPMDLQEWRERCQHSVGIDRLYEKLERRGLDYGPEFRPTEALWTGKACFFANITASEAVLESVHLVHPTLLDAALQPVLYIAKGDRLFVPNAIATVHYSGIRPTEKLFAFGQLVRQEPNYLEADVYLCTEGGEPVVIIEGIACQQIEGQDSGDESIIYLPEWRTEVFEVGGEADEAMASRNLLLAMPQADFPEALLAEQLLQMGARRLDWKPEGGLVSMDLSAGSGAEEVPVLLFPSAGAAVTDYGAFSARLEAFLDLIRLAVAADVSLRLLVFGINDSGVDPLLSSLAGLALTAQNEYPQLEVLVIHLSPEDVCVQGNRILNEIKRETSGEILLRGSERFVKSLPRRRPRAEEVPLQRVSVDEPVYLESDDSGKLSGLHFCRGQRQPPGPGEVEVRIESAALNYKDLLKLYGRLHPLVLNDTYFGTTLGMEASGKVVAVGPDCEHGLVAGDTVLLLLPSGFRSYATVSETFVVKAPADMGKAGASIPVVYLTALHGLEKVAQITAGERVLIHQASGGLGLAAIDVARKCGVEIFATAGSENKRRFLREMGIEHVFPSRDLSFVELILAATKGVGVDVILSAQVGAAQRESLSLLRPGGRFIDVGKKDVIGDAGLPLRAFNRNLMFAAIDMDRLMVDRPSYIRSLMLEIVTSFEAGELRGIETESFPAEEVELAFNRMAQSQHTGKLLLDFENGEVETPANEQREGTIRRDGSYLITGGTAGFGLATAHWLARKGAGRVVLLSRRGRATEGLGEACTYLESEGSEVVVLQGDVTVKEDLEKARTAMNAGDCSIAGIVHGAMVLDDAFLADLDLDRFRGVLRPKVMGALALAEVFATDSLDFMVFYSSISALIGNRGQASYVAANAFLDGFAEQLRAQGMPAVSINWGAIAETGVVARSEMLGAALEASGVRGLSSRAAFHALERVLESKVARAAVMDVDWLLWKESNPKLIADSRFREHVEGGGSAIGNETAIALRNEIEGLEPAQQSSLLEETVAAVVGEVLKTSVNSLNLDTKLSDMGVDSLLMMELSLNMKEKTGVAFTAMDFLKGPTIRELGRELRTRLCGEST